MDHLGFYQVGGPLGARGKLRRGILSSCWFHDTTTGFHQVRHVLCICAVWKPLAAINLVTTENSNQIQQSP
jgi:hypothetical protein